VAADAADPAWTAALALAAGRCEPIVWVATEGNVNAEMSAERLAALAAAIEEGCEGTGLAWRGLGDVLDAVTLCLNSPVKVGLSGKILATTDLLGRLPEEGSEAGSPWSRVKGKRWAWCGQVFGTSSQAAYRAMCSLFIAPASAWVFDGYKDEQPWSRYDGTAAAGPLRAIRLDVALNDTPDNGERAWRLRSSPGVRAGLIAVNTHGGADEFNLEPGRCRPGDIPFLEVPAIVYFVHSYSAKVPGERMTVAGRWLERGVYAYLGSTDEPFLNAFVPTPAVMGRLASTMAWGAAVRYDDATEAWKLATIGDPLITIGPAPVAAGSGLPLEGATDLDELLRAAASERRYEDAIAVMTLLGRDADAAKLAAALIRDDPAAFSAKVAMVSVMPLYRAGDAASIVKAFGMFARDQADGPLKDALWQACYTASPRDEAMLGVLRANLRPDQAGRDAAELARPIAQLYGRETAAAMLTEARKASMTDDDRSRADEALKMLNLLPRRR